MAFVAIPSADIEVGKPVKKDLWDKTKGNLDDHETRINDAETQLDTAGRTYVFNVNGQGAVIDEADVDFVQAKARITGITMHVKQAGSSGTVTMDVELKRGAGSFSSILSSPVSIAQTAGDYAKATATVSTTDLEIDDIIRINIDAIQTGATGYKLIIQTQARA
jgi:hypothetical protein